MLRLCRSTLKGVCWVEEQMGGLLLLASIVLVFAQIVMRFFGTGISGLYELATFFVIWSVFLTAGVGIQREIHVRVDVILLICPAQVALVLKVAGGLLIVFMSIMLFYSGYMLVQESLIFGDRTIGTISIPMWIPQLIMPISGCLMLIHSVGYLIRTIQAGPRNATLDLVEDVSTLT